MAAVCVIGLADTANVLTALAGQCAVESVRR